MTPPFLTRVAIKNYKSIAACDVRLGALTFLVGPNGSGKSNFLDALRFVADALNAPLDHALRDRGGIHEVRRRSTGHPTHFGVSLEFRTESGHGRYAFDIAAEKEGGFSVRREECRFEGTRHEAELVVRNGLVSALSVDELSGQGSTRHSHEYLLPPVASDRLYLANASGLPGFREVFDALSGMAFYNLNPQAMRELQPPDARETLTHDGANIASVFRHLRAHGDQRQIVEEYLRLVVPGIRGVDFKAVGPRETLEFLQEVPGGRQPWRFYASSMSDGTLRTFGTLVALFQKGSSRRPVTLVGIEEPETALHPAAAGVLRDCLREAAQTTQVVVTSHSPDLLDDPACADALLAVVAQEGETKIGPVDPAARAVLADRLFTPGELLRLDQMRPDAALLPDYQTLDLFASDGASR